MIEKSRYSLFCDMIEELDTAYSLIGEYDSLLHDYNGVILYQAESQLIKMIGNYPGISANECAGILKKTLSACSQLIKKLRTKKWVRQVRNENNNRVYNLYLTDAGKMIYENHKIFEEGCYRRTYSLLDSFSEEDLSTFIRIQQEINQGFRLDIEDSKALTLDTGREENGDARNYI